jgi:hypothetical protein
MPVLRLDNLPDFAQRELLDFYQFLLKKYVIEQQPAIPQKPFLVPRLVKPFEPIRREELYER